MRAGQRQLAGIAKEGAEERVLTVAYNALDPAAAEAWVDATLARFGRIDALIDNAGALRPASIEDGKDEDFEHLWQVNAMGPLRLTRAALPHLKRSGSGRIVNLVSLSGKRVRGDNVGYALCPAWVATDMATHAGVTPKEMIQPTTCASWSRRCWRCPTTRASPDCS